MNGCDDDTNDTKAPGRLYRIVRPGLALSCLIVTANIGAQTSGESTTNDWGAMTNGVQVSIRLNGDRKEANVYQSIKLDVRFNNTSTNQILGLNYQDSVETDDVFAFTIISPQGKDISPLMKPSFVPGSSQGIRVGPNRIGGMEFNLSRVCNMDEPGTYKVIAKARVGLFGNFFWVVSNPLAIKVASPERARATNATAASNILYEARTLSRQSFSTKSPEARPSNGRSFRTKPPADRQQNFAAYRNLLGAWSTNAIAPAGETAEVTLFNRVFVDAAKRPDLLDELIATYGRWHGEPGPGVPQVTRPPPLRTTHLTEAYRPAWEALLLAPPASEIEFMQSRFSITEALPQIGNPASVPVLELAFNATCEEGVNAGEGTTAFERQFRVLQCLNRFTTEQSLQAMLRCLKRAETNASGPLPKISGHDLRGWVERCLTDKDNYRNKDEWRAVLSSFSTDDLPADQRELLERAKRELDKEK